MTDPVAIILAAGQGSRFRAAAGADQDKLLAPCRGLSGDERPVLHHVLHTLGTLVARRIVVTRPDNLHTIELAQAHGCEVVTLASAGMGDSLAAAVAASADAAGWLVLLGDMPFIQAQTLRAVLVAMQPSSITVPVGAQGYGHPVGFGQAHGPALRALTGDQGGRKLFAQANLIEVPVDDPGIYRDVDTPAQLLS